MEASRGEDGSEDSEEHAGGPGLPDERAGSLPGFLAVEEKKKLGHLCKLLIDQGRVAYLQQRGFRPALQYYTDPAVSLENVLLTALPTPSAAQATA